jgi:hypothetical protein
MRHHLIIPFLTILLFSCDQNKTIDDYKDLTIIDRSGIDVDYAISSFSEKCTRKHNLRINEDGYQQNNLRIIIADTAEYSAEYGFTAESFVVRSTADNEITIVPADKRACVYAFQSLYEYFFYHEETIRDIEISENPAFAFRAIKFNLPWNSYREHESLQLHSETLRDLRFWEGFLDMMSQNRFNTLTLWSVHPWTYMVRPEKYPEACPFDDDELRTWQDYWHGLFALAGERGIRVFMINWNIFVSPEFSEAHGVAEYSQHLDYGYNGDGDYSELVQRYNSEVVEQVLKEYPELTGIGVSQNERMKGLNVTEEQWQQWIVDTYFDIVQEARPNGEFIIRGHTHPAPELTRAAIENNAARLPEKVWVPLKYNWSHGHARPRLFYIHGGSGSDIWWNPLPERYKVVFTIRNEDFFVLRWGSYSFIRELVEFNLPNLGVGGFIIGSETYIPAYDYITRPGAYRSWDYAFEKQWLFYTLWGRLMYDSGLDMKIFSGYYNERYDFTDGDLLIEAYDLGSQMPLKLASYYGATWDFTLYSEGFLSGYRPWRGEKWDNHSPFLSVEDIIGANPIDSSWLNVDEYVRLLENGDSLPEGITTPLDIAEDLEKSGREALKLIKPFETEDPTLRHELADIKAWSYLSLYFSEKLKGCIDFELYRKQAAEARKENAVNHLTEALHYWDMVIETTSPYFEEIPLLHLRDNFIEENFTVPINKFSWKNLRDQVERDISYIKKWQNPNP